MCTQGENLPQHLLLPHLEKPLLSFVLSFNWSAHKHCFPHNHTLCRALETWLYARWNKADKGQPRTLALCSPTHASFTSVVAFSPVPVHLEYLLMESLLSSSKGLRPPHTLISNMHFEEDLHVPHTDARIHKDTARVSPLHASSNSARAIAHVQANVHTRLSITRFQRVHTTERLPGYMQNLPHKLNN